MDEINSDSSEIDDLNYKKKKVEELGSTLAQIRARMKSYRSCSKKEDSNIPSGSSPPLVSERSAYLKQLLEEDKAKVEILERERPKVEEEVDKLLIEHEQFKQLMKELDTTQESESPEPEVPEVVRKRILQMESTIHMLQESLSEKDKVLKSKTEALQLLNQQIAQRSTEAIENSKLMSKEFERNKAIIAKREQMLIEELEACQQRLNEAQSLNIEKQNEKYDFDKVNSELEELKSLHTQCEHKYQEIKKALDSEKKIAIKLKAQYKNLKNEKSAKEALAAEVEQLQQLVASLEEEKGNLMLQLVDFEEMKESSLSSLNRVKDLESALETTSNELSSFKESYHVLKKDYDAATISIKDLKNEINLLEEQADLNKQNKIVAEMKAVELEEKLDFFNKDVDRTHQDKISKELENLKCYINELETNILGLTESLATKENEILELKRTKVNETEECSILNHSELKNLLSEWKEKYSLVQGNITRIEEEKEHLLGQIHLIQQEVDSLDCKNKRLLQDLNEKESLLSDGEMQNRNLNEALVECREKISILEGQLKSSKEEKVETPEGATKTPQDQTLKLRKLAANLKNKVKVCKELENEVETLKGTILENNECIAKLMEEKVEFERALNDLKNTSGVSSHLELIEELKLLLSEKDIIISNLEEAKGKALLAVEKDCAQRVRAESYSEISEKETEIKLLKEENLLLESRLNENLIEIHSVEEPELKESSVADSTGQKPMEKESLERQIENCNAQINDLLEEIKTKSNRLCELEKLNDNLENQLTNINVSYSESQKVIEELQDQLNTVKNELEETCLFRDRLQENTAELDSLRETVKWLETELSTSNQTVLSKEEMINFFQTEMETLKQDISESETRLEEFREMYQQESSVLSEKLKEKETYIVALEEDLVNMKNKVYNLETKIQEGQRIMEEQVALLGGRLNQAESVNTSMEQYRREMDIKSNQFAESEQQLKNEISELINQLDGMKSANEDLLKRNNELEASGKQLQDNISVLDSELNDIKNAYNTTLDQIELLNGELNQVMSQIEHRNEELIRISGERKSMAEKITELETACSELQSQLQNSEIESENLKCELDTKLKMLEEASAEITNLQAQLGTTQSVDSQALNMELESLRKDYEDRLKELQVKKDNLVTELHRNTEEQVDAAVKTEEGAVQTFTWQDDANNPFECKEMGWDVPEPRWDVSEPKFEGHTDLTQHLQLQSLINEKESENAQLKEEVKTLQVKCVKLASKLKEMKISLKKLETSKSSSSSFGDLDFAVQEELRSQIDSLETKNRELLSEINSLKLEKERLLKRVDTLTSANEQYLELKERQDIEVLMWQRKFSDLKTQLETFEWTSDMQEESGKESDKNNDFNRQELEEKLAILESENDELQQVVCSLKDFKLENAKLQSELNVLREEITNFKSNPEFPKVSCFNDNQLLSDQEITKLNNLLEAEKKSSLEYIKSVESLTLEKDELQRKVDFLNEELKSFQNRFDPLLSQIGQMTSDNDALQSEIDSLRNLEKRNEECESQINQLLSTVQQIEGLKVELFNLQNEIGNLHNVIQNLNEQNSALNKLCEDKTAELENIKSSMFVGKGVKVEEIIRKVDVPMSEREAPSSVMTSDEGAPPIFKGFFSEGDDPFTSVTIQQRSPDQKKNENIDDILKQVKELEEEKCKLIQRVHSLTEESSELIQCKQKINNLSEQLSVLSNDLNHAAQEKDKLLQENERQSSLIGQLENQVTLWKDQVSRLQMQIGEIQNLHAQQLENVRLSGILNNQEKMSHDFENRETGFKNALLAKDEENAHLVCEISAKNQLCEKQTNEISVLKSQVEKLQIEISETKKMNDNIKSAHQKLEEEYNKCFFELNNIRGGRDADSQQYIAKVDYLTQLVQEKEFSIENLTRKCEELEKVISKLEYDIVLNSERCSELEKDRENLQDKLNVSIQDVRNHYEKLSFLTQEKEQTEMTMKQLVEELNTERVRLKEVSVEIEALRSGESGRLQSLAEKVEFLESAITEKDVEIERLSKLLTGLQEKLIETENSKTSDQVIQLQGKLDEVFYTLHLRDVRCDELTIEIMRLLEERDSLQLRLSHALRENEGLRGVATTTQESPVPSMVPTEQRQKQLDEVRTGYMKDPDVKMDMQSRHTQQMQLLSQQASSSAANKSEETADYGIFNWFFGSSATPVPAQDQT